MQKFKLLTNVFYNDFIKSHFSISKKSKRGSFLLVNFVFILIYLVVSRFNNITTELYLLLVLSLMLMPISIRRMNDVGKSHWTFMWLVLPIIGWLYVLYLLTFKGSTATVDTGGMDIEKNDNFILFFSMIMIVLLLAINYFIKPTIHQYQIDIVDIMELTDTMMQSRDAPVKIFAKSEGDIVIIDAIFNENKSPISHNEVIYAATKMLVSHCFLNEDYMEAGGTISYTVKTQSNQLLFMEIINKTKCDEIIANLDNSISIEQTGIEKNMEKFLKPLKEIEFDVESDYKTLPLPDQII